MFNSYPYLASCQAEVKLQTCRREAAVAQALGEPSLLTKAAGLLKAKLSRARPAWIPLAQAIKEVRVIP